MSDSQKVEQQSAIYKPTLSIKSWAEEDRPREKLLLKGKQALSNAELIAILIGSGSREETAVDLSKRILQRVDNNLNELGKVSVKDLMQFKGIGEAKAITIAAALELGRRRQFSAFKERPQIRSSRDAFNVIAPYLIDKKHEEFWIVMLNQSNLVIGQAQISSGGIAGTAVDAKMVFKKALDTQATAIILSHNHPSGSLVPSNADIKITQKLVEAGKLLDINVLDHVIVSEKGYVSFMDEGYM